MKMTLNQKQRDALSIASAGHNLLLLGSAGTGKSHLITEICKELNEKGKQVKLTCSTGIACAVYPTHLKPMTIHKFTGIDDGRHDPNEIVSVLKNNAKCDKIIDAIMTTDVLIVDECSMISKRTFESIKKVCEIKNPCKIFGGIQIIFSGDFFQLPPVPNKRYNDDGTYCFLSEFFQTCFSHTVTLTQNVRQDEELFVKVISDIYQGNLTECVIEFMNSVNKSLPGNCDSLKLFSTNLLVDTYNHQCLLNSPGDLFEFKATDNGNAAELKSLTVPKTLWLKLECPVILLRNLSDTLVNGLRGILKYATETKLAVYFPSLQKTQTLHKESFTVFDPRTNSDIASRMQFPVKPAFALTIHKAQGMTLPWLEVDCNDIFKTGQLGVAISRVKSSKGLRVINFHPRYIFSPPAAIKQISDMKSNGMIEDFSCCRMIR
ncbi:uncharacterized protein LOC132720611 [Ruditapes philippinarum]|uniref:uncharacterized protein LOC132720611 n=1 Tax=Ruditapes philippinarum TaxID=129788 RepID=UPI00295BC4AA|nr:uncharacterized protein LOC132720611 [Ruditapes philippinarum]